MSKSNRGILNLPSHSQKIAAGEPDWNSEFRKYHGTSFDPNSSIDAGKMEGLRKIYSRFGKLSPSLVYDTPANGNPGGIGTAENVPTTNLPPDPFKSRGNPGLVGTAENVPTTNLPPDPFQAQVANRPFDRSGSTQRVTNRPFDRSGSQGRIQEGLAAFGPAGAAPMQSKPMTTMAGVMSSGQVPTSNLPPDPFQSRGNPGSIGTAENVPKTNLPPDPFQTRSLPVARETSSLGNPQKSVAAPPASPRMTGTVPAPPAMGKLGPAPDPFGRTPEQLDFERVQRGQAQAESSYSAAEQAPRSLKPMKLQANGPFPAHSGPSAAKPLGKPASTKLNSSPSYKPVSLGTNKSPGGSPLGKPSKPGAGADMDFKIKPSSGVTAARG